MDPDPKERLRQLAESIAGLIEQERPLATRSIPPDLGAWFVASVERLAADKEPDLAEALRKAFTTRSPGRPKQKTARYDQLKQAHALRKTGKTWPQIADALGEDDVSALTKAYNARKDDLQNDDIANRLVTRIGRKK